jgi:hypothetical protein
LTGVAHTERIPHRLLADLHGVCDVKDRSEERSPRSFTGDRPRRKILGAVFDVTNPMKVGEEPVGNPFGV